MAMTGLAKDQRSKERLWGKFEAELAAFPEDTWECLAPRAQVEGLGASHIYKLFVRRRADTGRRRRWWLFEEDIILTNTTDYADVGYGNVEARKLVKGPIALLRGSHAEPRNGGRTQAPPALTKALVMIGTQFGF